jgi:hypothetical protein
MKRSLALLAGLALALSTSTGFAEELPESPRVGSAQPSVQVVVRNRPLQKKRISWIENSLYGGVIATHAADWASTQQCLRTSQEQEQSGPRSVRGNYGGARSLFAIRAHEAPSRAYCPHLPARQYSGHCVCGGTQLPYDPCGSIPIEENVLRCFSLGILLAQQSARH